MVLRILVWLALLAGAWWLLRKRDKVPPPPAAPGAPGTPGAPAPRALAKAEPMVDCARCGLHFPSSEALVDAEGRLFCGAEHRASGPRDPR